MNTILNLNLKAEIKITSFLNDPLLHGRPWKFFNGSTLFDFFRRGQRPQRAPKYFLKKYPSSKKTPKSVNYKIQREVELTN